jgi:ATP synthase F1 delta subunit
MNIQENMLARRYALAFLNIYGNTFSLDNYYAVKKAYQFLKNNRDIKSLFKLPDVESAKKECIKKIIEEFSLPVSLYALVDLLLKNQRLFLLTEIFGYILECYANSHNILEFSFESSHQLTADQLSCIKKFLEKKTKKTILYKETINKKLIAGIRLLSNSLLWEHSVAQQLQKAGQLLRSKERR